MLDAVGRGDLPAAQAAAGAHPVAGLIAAAERADGAEAAWDHMGAEAALIEVDASIKASAAQSR